MSGTAGLEESVSSNLPAIPSKGSPLTAEMVTRIEQRVAKSIAHIHDIDSLQEWRAQAAALEAYLRSRGLQRPMLGAQRRVEARIGQLLGKPKIGVMTPISGDSHLREDFRILAHAFNDVPLTDHEWQKSRRALVALIRRRAGLLPPTPPLPEGTFRCIVADPPWRLDTGPDVFGGTGERGHDALAYRQMSVEEISALNVKEHAAPDAHLYLWTTNRYVEQSYGIVRAWGFTPSVLLVWAKKPRGIGLGDKYRLTTEFILYARRGKLEELRICDRTWFDWPRGRHSEKPGGFYELVESMSPAPGGERERLEMFARGPRNGWTVWGDESAR